MRRFSREEMFELELRWAMGQTSREIALALDVEPRHIIARVGRQRKRGRPFEQRGGASGASSPYQSIPH